VGAYEDLFIRTVWVAMRLRSNHMKKQFNHNYITRTAMEITISRISPAMQDVEYSMIG